jgi:hypothetical protein
MQPEPQRGSREVAERPLTHARRRLSLGESWQPGSYGKPILEANGQLVEDLRPVGDGPGPLLDDVYIGQVKQFANSLPTGERRLVFGDFAQLAIIAFDGVGGVNQAPDFCGVVEEGG